MILIDRAGHKLDHTTYLRLRAAEKACGFTLPITQGSWNGSVAQSTGTHDGGGVVDISVRNMTKAQIGKAVRQLRLAGLIAWHRTAAQGPWSAHIHAVERASTSLSPSAARQVTAWANGRNGLANNAPDDGPRVTVPKELPMNNVQRFRELVSFAYQEYASRVPKRRPAAWAMFRSIQAALKVGPKA